MIQPRKRAALLSLFTALVIAIIAGCSGGGESGDDDDDDDDDGAQCTPLPNNNLSTLQSAIFTPQCALSSCHDSVVPVGELDLSSASVSHAEMVNIPALALFNSATIDRVEPGNANASMLYLKVIGAPGMNPPNQMPDVPGQELCAEKIDAIEAWINAGAPNN